MKPSRVVRIAKTPQINGVVDPNPGVARLSPLPSVLGTPLTPTTSARNVSAITGTNVINWNSDHLRVLGPTLIQSPTETQMGRPSSRVSGYWVEFMHDGQYIEVAMRGAGDSSAHRLMVDGQWATASYAGGLAGGVGTDSGHYYTKYDFGSRAIRHCRLLIAPNGTSDVADWRGVKGEAIDTFWAPHSPVGPTVVFFGDSWTKGIAAGFQGDAYGFITGMLLGYYNVIVSGLPGTGYSKTSGASPKWAGRIQADCLDYDPAIIALLGSINDDGIDAATITAEANALYAQIRTALPTVKLVVFGTQNPGGALGATTLATKNAVTAAAATNANVDLYVDPIVNTTASTSTLGWFTGTGKTGATAGDGNSDVYVNGADNHPTKEGHRYIAFRQASSIADWMSSQ